MPSAKILSEKQAYVADLKAKFESAVSGCVVAYGGINVENDTKLRKELREAGVDYMVVKNTMLRLAVKGTSLETLAEQFKGDTAIAFAHEEDPMSAARILCKYQDGDKSKKFVVKAGFMEGKVMDAAETNAIAKLPNREGMLFDTHDAGGQHLGVVDHQQVTRLKIFRQIAEDPVLDAVVFLAQDHQAGRITGGCRLLCNELFG